MSFVSKEYDEAVITWGMNLDVKGVIKHPKFWNWVMKYWELNLFMWSEMYKAMLRMEMPKIEDMDPAYKEELRIKAEEVCFRPKTEITLFFFQKMLHCINHLN